MRTGNRGFTLIELLVALVLVGILAAIAAPMVSKSVGKGKEAALRENLFVIRKALDGYYADHGRYPEELSLLKREHYLRALPNDPVSCRDWRLIYSNGDEEKGIVDVRSSAEGTANDGAPYAQW
mgnify:CR=1 FL=1